MVPGLEEHSTSSQRLSLLLTWLWDAYQVLTGLRRMKLRGAPVRGYTGWQSPELWWGRTMNIPTPLTPSSVSSDLGCRSRCCLGGRIQAHTTATPPHVSTPTYPPGYVDTRHTHQTRDGGSPQTVKRLCLLAGEAALISKTHSRRESRFWDPTRDWFFSPFFSISKY